MRTHLAKISGMANGKYRNIGNHALHQRSEQVQVMAHHHIGAKFPYSPLDPLCKSSSKTRNHPIVHIAVARCAIGHFVRHAAYGKRHLICFEVNRIRAYAIRKWQRIVGGNAADNCGAVTSSYLATHHFSQIHAAARAIWFLGGDIQDPHCS